MPQDNRLQIHQGEDYNTLIVLVTDASLDTINLSGYTGYLHAKKYPPKLNAPLDISIASYQTDTSNGALYFALSSADTSLNEGDYAYQVWTSDGDQVFCVIDDILQVSKKLSG